MHRKKKTIDSFFLINKHISVYTCKGKETNASEVNKTAKMIKLYLSSYKDMLISAKKMKGIDLLITNRVRNENILILVKNKTNEYTCSTLLVKLKMERLTMLTT